MQFKTWSRLLAAGVAFWGICLAAWFIGAAALQAAPAATLYVNTATGSDGNACTSSGAPCATIAAAIDKASSGDTIQIAAGTYNEHDVQVSKELTLIGAGAGSTIVDAGGNGRVFRINVSSTLSHMTIQNGLTPEDSNLFNTSGAGVLVGSYTNTVLDNVVIADSEASGNGGGVFNNGFLTISNSEIVANVANGIGGGIYNYNLGAITVTQSLVAENTAVGIQGGGIYTGQPLTLVDTTIRGNRVGTFGGGLYLTGDTTEMTNVTITENEAESGAGVFAGFGTVMTVTNSTVSGNVSGNNYAGLYLTGAGTELLMVNSTIAANTRTGTNGNGRNGLNVASGAVATVQNSIIANNQDYQCNSSTNFFSAGGNLASDYSCDFDAATDQEVVDPLLGMLADNGGGTPTHALLPGSPAIDAGVNAGCPADDQRGITRPFDGDNDSTATCDSGAYEAQNALVIADVEVTEGTGGSTTAVFTVTLSPASSQTVTVDYATANGAAAAGSDYTAKSNTLTFSPGATERTIEISVNTDSSDESDETFTVSLSNAANADILDGTAVGTIVDDDGLPSLTIGDVTVNERSSGVVNAVFDVTLSPPAPNVVTVQYATVGGTAVSPADYAAAADTLTFGVGETSKQISVAIVTDNIDEGDSESFTVQLSNPTNANIGDGTGTATLTDDDSARLSHGVGPQVLEGSSGTTPATFTVTLSTPAAFVVTVDYEISDGVTDDGAIAGEDYVGALSGTLTFQPGETQKTYSVDVIGDIFSEPDEVFSALISNANVPISVNGSLARILNDDDSNLYLPIVMR